MIMTNFIRFKVLPMLFLVFLTYETVKAVPTSNPHRQRVLHPGSIASSTSPLSQVNDPSPVYITVTQQKADELASASPAEQTLLFQDISSSVNAASKQFQENKPYDAMKTLASAHIMDFNNAIATATKDLLRKNATLRMEMDDLLTKLNLTFSNEDVKVQFALVLSVGGIGAAGLTIGGFFSRNAFQAWHPLRDIFRAQAMAESLIDQGVAPSMETAFAHVRRRLMAFNGYSYKRASQVTAEAMELTSASYSIRTSQVVASSLTFISALLLTVAIDIALYIAFEPKDIGAYMVNDSDEDFKNGKVYVKHGDLILPPLWSSQGAKEFAI